MWAERERYESARGLIMQRLSASMSLIVSLFLHQFLPVFTHVFCSIPVIITVLIRAEISSSRTDFVSSFSRFSKISSPRNIRSDSTWSLEVYE